MPQSLAQIILHTVFSTKDRRQMITGEIEAELHGYLIGILTNLGCVPIQVGGTTDHVHLLYGLSRTLTIASVVEKLKSNSSKWIKSKGGPFIEFYWQSGYGVFSVSQSNVDQVKAYVRNQKQHHLKMTFQEEYRLMLRRNQLDYDERYVWD